MAVVALKAPYAGYDTDRLAAPIVSWEGRSFFFRGGSVGYRLHQTAQSELALTASPYVMRFKRRDSHDPQLRQLDNRSLSGMLGVSWRHQAEWGVLQANAQAEVTGHGAGSRPMPSTPTRSPPAV
ncbi:MipA/OmpV family protein [Stenotrophomonas rhizophila]